MANHEQSGHSGGKLMNAKAVAELTRENARLREELAAARNRASFSGKEGFEGLDGFSGEILNQVSDAVVAIDLEFRVTYLNAAAERQYGICRQEALGQKLDWVRTMKWPKEGEEAAARKQIRESGCWRGETVHVTRRGEIDVESNVSVLRDRGGASVGYLGVVRDITERKRAEEALLLAHQKLQGVLGSITDGLMVLDQQWRCTYFSEQGARMIGMRSEDIVGSCLWELFPATVGGKFQEFYQNSVAAGLPMRFEEYYPEPLNKWFECACYPSADGLSIYFRDVSERRQIEEQTRRLHELIAEEKDRLSTLINSTTDEIWMVNHEARITLVNPPASRSFYKNSVEFENVRTLAERLKVMGAEGGRRGVEQTPLLRALRGESLRNIEETVLVPATQELRHRLVSASPVRDQVGNVTGAVTVVRDITEHKRREILLRAQKEIFELVVAGGALGTVLQVVAQAARNYFHEAKTAIFLLDEVESCLRFGAAAGMKESFAQSLATLQIGPEYPSCGCAAYIGQSVIVPEVVKDERWQPYLALAEAFEMGACWSLPIQASGGKVLGTFALIYREARTPQAHELEAGQLFANTAAMLLERHQAAQERDVAQSGLQRLNAVLEERVLERTWELQTALDALEAEVQARRRLEQEVLEISEREQSRLGQDLHDDLGQQIAGISLLVQVVHTQLSAEGHPRLAQITQLKNYCQHALNATRSLAKSFYPVELERHGLKIALEDLAQRTESLAKIICETRFQPGFKVEKEAEIHLYRIVQESISNAVKHGRTKHIVIEGLAGADTMGLLISNDGRPFCAPGKGCADGIGLHIFKYRARLIGAQLEVTPRDEQGGCQVACIWPLPV